MNYTAKQAEINALYSQFRQWATEFGICAGMIQQRIKADQRLIHYENKIPLLRANNEKFVRNQEKLRTAKMTFDEINTATFEKMKSLAQDKQKYMNPIVTKFLRLNMEFFRKNA